MIELIPASAGFTVPYGEQWQDYSSCGLGAIATGKENIDPETFFQDKPNEISGKFLAEKARVICNTCPVANWCLKDAINNGEEYGVWGGLTQPELKRVRLSRRKNERPVTLEEAPDIRAKYAKPLTTSKIAPMLHSYARTLRKRQQKQEAAAAVAEEETTPTA